ncbi:MAG: DUF2478 domain-containing protein [Paracoccaceae bacterium]|nr:MAG: DUF2478 domain-containing protein [Paracoccaceae bacterium]
MLGVVHTEGRGAGDRLMAEIARRLLAEGLPVAGILQENIEHDPLRMCHMDLTLLDGSARFRISEDRGPHATGCRLDPQALEEAVGWIEAALSRHPRLLIVNKFGKQEADGRGFRPVIGRALTEGVAVLTTVRPGHRAAFEEFAGDLALPLVPQADAVVAWARRFCL